MNAQDEFNFDAGNAGEGYTRWQVERQTALVELARRLGVSRQTINAVETDKYDPSLPLALRLAKLCDVAVTELFIDRWEPEKE